MDNHPLSQIKHLLVQSLEYNSNAIPSPEMQNTLSELILEIKNSPDFISSFNQLISFLYSQVPIFYRDTIIHLISTEISEDIPYLQSMAINNKSKEALKLLSIVDRSLQSKFFLNMDLEQLNLSGCDLSFAKFNQSSLRFSRLSKANLFNTDMNSCNLLGINLGESIPLPSFSLFNRSFDFSPCGNFIAGGSGSGEVKIWNLDSTMYRTIKHSTVLVKVVKYSPDGQFLVVFTRDSQIYVFETSSFQIAYRYHGHCLEDSSIVFSPDSKFIAFPFLDLTIRVMHFLTHQIVCSVPANALAFSPDTSLIAWGGDSTIHIKEISTDETLGLTQGSPISCLVFMDLNILLCSTNSGDICIWNLLQKAKTLSFTAHTDSIVSLFFIRQNQLIVSASKDNTIKISDTKTGFLRACLKGKSRYNSGKFADSMYRVAINDRFIIDRSKIHEIDSELLSMDKDQLVHDASILCFAFTKEGEVLATGSQDNTAIIWNTAVGRGLIRLVGHSSYVTALAFSPDGKFLVSGSCDKSVKVWEAPENTWNMNCTQMIGNTGISKNMESVFTFKGHKDKINCVTYDLPGVYIYSCSDDFTIKVWCPKTQQLVYTLTDHEFPVKQLQFTPDGNYTITIDSQGRRLIYKKAELDRTLREIGGTHHELSISADGKYFGIYNYRQRSLFVNNTFNNKAFKVISRLYKPISIIRFSPMSSNELLVAAGDSRYKIKVWDVYTGQFRAKIPSQIHCLSSFAFSIDGKKLVTGGSDGSLACWTFLFKNTTSIPN